MLPLENPVSLLSSMHHCKEETFMYETHVDPHPLLHIPALLTRFSDNIFLQTYTTTIGIDFNSKMIRVDKAICKLEIWDTAGQERFSTITANYYRGAQGALLVYDVGNRESFTHIQNWYDR